MPLLFLIQFLTFCSIPVLASDFGVSLGDFAVTQVLEHVTNKFLEETRVADILLKTKEEPKFGSLAHLKLFNTVSYRNISVQFFPNLVHIHFEKLHVISHANISDVLWPIAFSDSFIDSHVIVPKGKLRFQIDEQNQKVELETCSLHQPNVSFHLRDSWLINKGMSALGSMMSSIFEGAICQMIHSSANELSENQRKNTRKRVPIFSYLPKKIQDHMSARNTTLFYRVTSISAQRHQLLVNAQIEWQNVEKLTEKDDAEKLLSGSETDGSNSTNKVATVEWRNGDLMTIWLEDAILNEILDQIDWNFEWMNEQIPVSSPIIPADSREFLSTLCTECFFQVNVNAKGRPTIAATNQSLVLTKTDRVNLRVSNPEKNVTSIFVSLVLTIQAELRPSFENGRLRTGVELLDTKIEMENGAFPKAWGFFMSDLIRGMIMDMMWPELKSTIEDLTYAKGLKISNYCGIDPQNAKIEIGEGIFSISTRLTLNMLRSETCLRDLSSSLPNTSRLFQKASLKKR
ncbi:unnamed protein product [Caenorhabditis angaria]|uniref:Lipid-binding serum glycoprotein C-terminal domain-containing protein n=1 Tax=Caenorhabditis angaria TaxID=860376 RepID=A0A9P1IR92_9PELO|nr:unnamed protein product [Caenorhabditis angaria]